MASDTAPRVTPFPNAPFFDKSGNISRVWFHFLYQVFTSAAGLEAVQVLEAFDAGQVDFGPAIADLANGAALGDSSPDRLRAIEELQAQVALAGETGIDPGRISDLEKLVWLLTGDSAQAIANVQTSVEDLTRLIWSLVGDIQADVDAATGVTSLNALTGAVVLQDGIGTQVDVSGQNINLSFAPKFLQKNADYSVTDADMGLAFIISAAHTCTLQHGGSVVPSRLLWIANYYNSTAVLTIAAHAGDVIGGLANYTLDPGQGILLQWDGGNQWVVVALRGDPPPIVLTFTATQIKAMHATPLQLVAAAGAGTIIQVDSVLLNFQYNSATYANGGTIQVYYGGGTDVIATTPAAFLVGPTQSQVVSLVGAIPEGNLTDMANQNVYLWNATAAFTAGDGPVLAVVKYRVVRGLG